jgi:hypothetical protein
MSATNAPFGVRPSSHPSGVIRQEERINGIASGYSTALYTGTPIKNTTDGTLVATATGADSTIGSFQGCEFNSAGKRFVLPYWPASQTYDSDGTMVAYFTADKNITYEGQCDGSVAMTALWEGINLVDASTGSTYTGYSSQRLNHTTTGATTATWTVTGLGEDVFNAWGDAFTIVRVMIQTYQAAIA